MSTDARLTLIKERHLERLRRVETAILAEVTAAGLSEDEIRHLAPELSEISTEIKKIEIGTVWYVFGPGEKLFRCEDSSVSS